MDDHQADLPRRSFFVRAVTAGVAGVVGLVPLLAGLAFLCDPLLRRKQAGSGDFLPLAIGPDALPADGTPQSVEVVADRVDAWNRYPQQPVGSIWLRREADGQIVAFSSICPHLGCAVDFRSAQRDFFCPCHLSQFTLDGERQNKIPPRDMDRLETEVRDGKIWVKYQIFRGGVPEKTVV